MDFANLAKSTSGNKMLLFRFNQARIARGEQSVSIKNLQAYLKHDPNVLARYGISIQNTSAME